MRTSTRIARLKKYIEGKLPEIKKIVTTEAEVVILHQDAFAGDYQMHEYTLLGMYIKYLGLAGKEIRIIGKNRETIDK